MQLDLVLFITMSFTIFLITVAITLSNSLTPASFVYPLIIVSIASSVNLTFFEVNPCSVISFGIKCFFAISSFSYSV